MALGDFKVGNGLNRTETTKVIDLAQGGLSPLVVEPVPLENGDIPELELSQDFLVTVNQTPIEGQTLTYINKVKMKGADMNFLGTIIPEKFLSNDLEIKATYTKGEWLVKANVDSLVPVNTKLDTSVKEESVSSKDSSKETLFSRILKTSTLLRTGDEIEIILFGNFKPNGSNSTLDLEIYDSEGRSSTLFSFENPILIEGNYIIRSMIEKKENNDFKITSTFMSNNNIVRVYTNDINIDTTKNVSIGLELDQDGTPSPGDVTVENFKLLNI